VVFIDPFLLTHMMDSSVSPIVEFFVRNSLLVSSLSLPMTILCAYVFKLPPPSKESVKVDVSLIGDYFSRRTRFPVPHHK